MGDYSCYINIKNKSSKHIIGLVDFGCSEGEWPVEQPVNTIEPNTTGQLYLKDLLGTKGSRGWAKFEVPMGKYTETFELSFADPTGPLNENELKAVSSNPKVISVSVGEYSRGGHPFYGTVEVNVTAPHATYDEDGHVYEECNVIDSTTSIATVDTTDSPIRANFEIGFEGDTNFVVGKKPIHESIAIAAFIKSKVYTPRGTTFNNLNKKQWEYMRGLVWNDDPSCYLFDDQTYSNHVYSTGILWSHDYTIGDPRCMIQRSHYGDLQFLHSMVSKQGLHPEETKRELMRWLEVMYKLACGNQGVSGSDRIDKHFKDLFDNHTSPSDSDSLETLLLASTPGYNNVNLQRRALGSCMHVISDSYAVGHTQRQLKNPNEYIGRGDNNYYRFQPGTFGGWGPIVSFHSYKGQEEKKHAHYDGKGMNTDPKNLTSFNSITGARNAIDACTDLINFWKSRTPWKKGPAEFLDTNVFKLHSKAIPSNNKVDHDEPWTTSVSQDVTEESDQEYEAGLYRKLANLDCTYTNDFKPFIRRSVRRNLLLSGLITLGLFVVALIFSLVCMLYDRV